ncbi:MAG: HAMP domain-containing histidine kinase [Bacteroidetes bacterium]|nr:HAMP domain-containing histidine kinase [Bacteroidota bacterium]MBI3482488.1 HAMP domain-containing histidine kinase [Bacteroidota bacterium]
MNTINASKNLAIVNKLAQANHVIDKFISSCSHSMRGPLKTIQGLVNLVSKEENTEVKDSNHMLELIQKTADQMEHVLIELEEFLENSKTDLKVDEVDVSEIISELQNRFHEDLEERSIECSFQVSKNTKLVTDKTRLTTILSHILSNAINYYDPGKVKRRIWIDVRIFSSSYEVSIKDNGIGIASTCVSKIFHPFYKGTEKSKGAGIGLYVVKEVIEKMKGLISVQTRLNAGTDFLVWLPNLN